MIALTGLSFEFYVHSARSELVLFFKTKKKNSAGRIFFMHRPRWPVRQGRGSPRGGQGSANSCVQQKLGRRDSSEFAEQRERLREASRQEGKDPELRRRAIQDSRSFKTEVSRRHGTFVQCWLEWKMLQPFWKTLWQALQMLSGTATRRTNSRTRRPPRTDENTPPQKRGRQCSQQHRSEQPEGETARRCIS